MTRKSNRAIEAEWADRDFIEDYTFLVDAGLTRTEIADRLGTSVDYLERRLAKLNVWYPERRYRPVLEWLERKIENRQEFTASDFPQRFDPNHVNAVLTMAVAAKRVAPTGRRQATQLSKNATVVIYAPT